MPVLDTSFLVDLNHGKNKALILLSRLGKDGTLRTTVMNALEICRGVYRSNKLTENLNEIMWVLEILSVLLIDVPVYTMFRALFATLKAKGRPISDFDTVITAIVLCHDGNVVTRDPHFHELPKLEVIEF